MAVERKRLCDPALSHDGKADRVHEAEILIGVLDEDSLGVSFQPCVGEDPADPAALTNRRKESCAERLPPKRRINAYASAMTRFVVADRFYCINLLYDAQGFPRRGGKTGRSR